MKKRVEFSGCASFVFDSQNTNLSLSSLFGMTCGMNGKDDVDTRAGLLLLCADEKRYEGHLLNSQYETNENIFTFSQTTCENDLRVDAKWEYHADSQIICCNYKLKNISDKTIAIRRALPRFVFSSGEYQVYSQLSRWGNENQGKFHPLGGGSLVLKARAARSTVGATPFCVLKDMETGKAVAFHVVPKGNWIIKIRSDVVSNEAPMAVVELGLADEDLFFELEPGMEMDLPEVIIQQVPDGDLRKLAAPLHKFLNREYLKDCPLRTPPMLYNTWLYRLTDFTVDQLRAQLKAAKKIGCECFIVDAGWFGPDDNSWSQVGDWREKPNEPFFGKMKDFADEVRKEGLKFGLWMEPERYAENIPVRETHPQWFPENSTRIDLTNPEAAEYFFQSIAEIVERYGVAYIKLDFNSSVGYDESGAELHGYCCSLNRQWSRLRNRFPDLVMENCASGSLRSDLDSAKLYDLSFSSDNAHPYETLRIRQGALLRGSIGRILNWAVIRSLPETLPKAEGAKVLAPCAATWNEMAQFDLNFVMISTMAGTMGFSGDLAGFDDKTLNEINEYCEYYKTKRKMLLDSVTHLLSPVEGVEKRESWIAFQVQSMDKSESLVFAFSDGASRRGTRYFSLRDLDADSEYIVERVFPKGNENAPTTCKGRDLMTSGAEIECQVNQHSKHIASLYSVRKRQ